MADEEDGTRARRRRRRGRGAAASGWLFDELDAVPSGSAPDRSAPPRRDPRSPAPPEETGTGRAPAPPLLWIVLGALLIAASLAVLWGSAQAGRAGTGAAGEQPASDQRGALAGGEEASTEPAEGGDTPTAAEESPGPAAEEVQRAMDTLEALPQTSDCTNLFADSQVIEAYGATLLVDGDWPNARSVRLLQLTFDDIAATCGPDYADRLARYVVGAPTAQDAVVYAVQEHYGALPQAYPPPDDAVADEAFRTASGNIRCTLTVDGAGCTIVVRAFENPPGCAGPEVGPFSVAVFGAEVLPCAGTIVGGSSQLATGATTAIGNYACTSEGASVRCWHTVSGAGFTLGPGGLTEQDSPAG